MLYNDQAKFILDRCLELGVWDESKASEGMMATYAHLKKCQNHDTSEHTTQSKLYVRH
jgi:hypothetical protein